MTFDTDEVDEIHWAKKEKKGDFSQNWQTQDEKERWFTLSSAPGAKNDTNFDIV